ncbi:MAG: protein-disulfide reductase DsbD [Pseudomonadota bacterium]
MLYFAKFFCAFVGFHCQSFEEVIKLEAKKSPSQKAVVSQWKKILFKILVGLLLGAVLSPTYAVQPLPAEQVFQVTTKQLNSKTLAVHWTIKPGYYLYREKIHFQSDQAKIQSVFLPQGIPKKNKFLGKYQIYLNGMTVLLRFAQPLQNNLALTVNYQGCAVAGFCYPPVTKVFTLKLHENGKAILEKKGQSPVSANEQGKAMQLLASHNIWLILLGFFGFGLLLSLTPCVLPLIPVLSAIILGQKQQLTTLKAFTLSLTYVLAMALTYASAGVFAGLAGSYLQAFLQSRWIIIFVSLVFVFLAFSLFGFYELRLPASWQEKLTNITNRQQGGNYLGVAFMGCLSTLVISPCITAPLVGVLTYIGNTGNAVLGGFALFILGLGSGIPLLIIGTSAGKWLPKSGPWMNGVKIILGIIMLLMAGWLLLRIIPLDSRSFHLFKTNQGVATAPTANNFQTVKGVTDLNQALIKAKRENKPILLDFYANWCISCKEMERIVFPAPQVKALLGNFIVLRADVTANDALDKALQKKFNVIAPPTFLFFTPDGQELRDERIVGQKGSSAFATQLNQILGLVLKTISPKQ